MIARMNHVWMAVVMAAVLLAGAAQTARAAETYEVDPVHSSVVFRIKHLDAAYVYGNFNEITGTFSIDPQSPERMKFDLTIPVKSIDTRNERRDTHLKSADFFDAEKFPEITFKSTSVEKVEGEENAYEVTGELTLLGVTKPLTAKVELTGTGTDQQGNRRAGVETVFTVKRSDYGMDFMMGPVGDEVRLMIALEGVAAEAEDEPDTR